MVALGLTSLVAVALFGMAQLQTLLHSEQQQTQGAQDNVHAAMAELVNSLRYTSTPYFRGFAVNAVPNFTPQPAAAVTVINSGTGPDGGSSWCPTRATSRRCSRWPTSSTPR